MKSKRGQAAMEFLMTYGWAILAAAVVIAALAAFGVFTPGKFVAARCTVSAPFGCTEHSADASDGVISMVLQNGAGEDVTISSIAISGTGTTVACTTNSTSAAITDGATRVTTIACSGAGFATGKKVKGDIEIIYTKGTGTLPMTAAGSIIVPVAA